MSQDLYDLPAGWGWKRLGDVLDVRDGTHDSPKFVDTGFPLITSKNLTPNGLDLTNIKYISKDDYDSINKRSNVDTGDILFAMIGTIGNPVLITSHPDFAIKNVALFKKKQLDQCMEYVKYYLMTPYTINSMTSLSKGATQKFVGLNFLRSFEIPLPPLAEQIRIVEKLDAVLSRIDTAIDELQQSLKLVDAMFKSGLDQAFNPLGSPSNEEGLYDLPEGWGWKPLKSVCKFENGDRGKNYPSRDAFVDSGIAVINAGALNGKTVDESELNFITRERFDLLGSGKVKRGDLLFCLRGSLGKCAIVTNLDEGAIASSLVIVRPNELLSSEFLLNYFNSGLSDNFIKKYNNGAAQPNLSAANLGKFEIPLPSIYDQQTIVKALDSLNEHTTQLKTELTAKIDLFNQLKASVLDGAFSGEV